MNFELTGESLEIALKALEEGRLWYRITDQYGRSCNGGAPIALPSSSAGKPGEWLPRIEDVKICRQGYHVTNDPIKWSGCIVSLVEIDKCVEQEKDKVVCHTMRELCVISPESCIDLRLYCIVKGRFQLEYSNLQGANLVGANLQGANLVGANLMGANLMGAALQGTNLMGANLMGANLQGANLQGANLVGANLWEANLQGSTLEEANLVGADLVGAALSWANLWGANLWGANLWGANLEGATLEGVNLKGANLIGTNLMGANLMGANLMGAIGIDKEDCKKRGAIVD